MGEARLAQRSLWQMGRYLLVGVFNSAFGFSLFAVLNFCLQSIGSHSYVLASLLSNLIAITGAFLGYKWFVFKTEGNYLKEWLRCITVYSSGVVLTLACLPVLVPLLRRFMVQRPQAAPYLAAAIMAVVTLVASFLGHKHISFAVKTDSGDDHSTASSFLTKD